MSLLPDYMQACIHSGLSHACTADRLFHVLGSAHALGKAAEHVLLPARMHQVEEAGHLNAIVFWFDLHLDEEASITTAPPGIGLGGRVLSKDVPAGTGSSGGQGDSMNPVRARGRAALQQMGRAPAAAAAAASPLKHAGLVAAGVRAHDSACII